MNEAEAPMDPAEIQQANQQAQQAAAPVVEQPAAAPVVEQPAVAPEVQPGDVQQPTQTNPMD